MTTGTRRRREPSSKAPTSTPTTTRTTRIQNTKPRTLQADADSPAFLPCTYLLHRHRATAAEIDALGLAVAAAPAATAPATDEAER